MSNIIHAAVGLMCGHSCSSKRLTAGICKLPEEYRYSSTLFYKTEINIWDFDTLQGLKDWVFLNSFVGLSAWHMASTQDTTKAVQRLGRPTKAKRIFNGNE